MNFSIGVLRTKKIFFGLLILLTVFSCKKPSHKLVEHGFYYWKTNFKLSSKDKEVLTKCDIKKLYIRFFDVAFDKINKQPKPVQPIILTDKFPVGIAIIPVVFITNETLQKTDSSQMATLGKNISNKITEMLKTADNKNVSEIQMDCDWSASTKEKYFNLIRAIRPFADENHWKISATIRLYQEKYFNTAGIPPVDRGTLMDYNMQPLTNPNVSNSIIDVNEENKYLGYLDKYPLKLDVVLPIFYWGVLFRNNQFYGILNNLSENDLKNNFSFTEISKNNYVAKIDVDLNSFHLFQNDRIRLESCSENVLEKSIELIDKKNKTDSLCFSFFSLDSLLIKPLGYEKINSLYARYR
ncbi:MAG TPA: hypothetical protein VNG53_11410 [Bacteroidia bacterium]|nr:hypothetical protein [Bacteroidia bacterium]